jgi:hypothetical protein
MFVVHVQVYVQVEVQVPDRGLRSFARKTRQEKETIL